jgi:hypothetical protein
MARRQSSAILDANSVSSGEFSVQPTSSSARRTKRASVRFRSVVWMLTAIVCVWPNLHFVQLVGRIRKAFELHRIGREPRNPYRNLSISGHNDCAIKNHLQNCIAQAAAGRALRMPKSA